MRKVSLALLFCLLCLTGMAQGQKALDLKDITSGRFRPENIQGVIPTPDGWPSAGCGCEAGRAAAHCSG